MSASPAEVNAQYKKSRDLRSLDFHDGNYDQISLNKAVLDGANLSRSVFQDAALAEVSLRKVNGTRAIFIKADLTGADLTEGNWSDTDFTSAILKGADLRGCTFTPQTRLNSAQVSGMYIDLHSLRMLGDSRGGLTTADLATLNITDDQAKLITSFGGFWTTLHVLAIAIFLTPYLVFAIRRYIAAQLRHCLPGADCVPLREALWDHILTGGIPGSVDIVALGLFLLLLLYNILRISLVFKARTLELAEHARKIPARFVLRKYWWFAYYACQVLVWLNISLALLHAYHFLGTLVPKAT
jgi:hypothetical protein